jgi:hypothetical protein
MMEDAMTDVDEREDVKCVGTAEEALRRNEKPWIRCVRGRVCALSREARRAAPLSSQPTAT